MLTLSKANKFKSKVILWSHCKSSVYVIFSQKNIDLGIKIEA